MGKLAHSSVQGFVTNSYCVDVVTGCWNWILTKDGKGYGRVSFGGVSCGAHRLSYEALVGPIPAGLVIDHLCRNPSCVNPAHLEPVTFKENILRGTNFAAVNARKTHCDHGHELAGVNLYLTVEGWRQCRRCNADAVARYRALKKAKTP